MKSYSGLGHTVTQDLLVYASAFLTRVLPHAPELALAPKDPSEMSVKELKAAVRNAGLSSQAIGFTEKLEFIKLLKDHQQSKLK